MYKENKKEWQSVLEKSLQFCNASKKLFSGHQATHLHLVITQWLPHAMPEHTLKGSLQYRTAVLVANIFFNKLKKKRCFKRLIIFDGIYSEFCVFPASVLFSTSTFIFCAESLRISQCYSSHPINTIYYYFSWDIILLSYMMECIPFTGLDGTGDWDLAWGPGLRQPLQGPPTRPGMSWLAGLVNGTKNRASWLVQYDHLSLQKQKADSTSKKQLFIG